jgi:CubicO group peptidase (beta-lactamase class C family)
MERNVYCTPNIVLVAEIVRLLTGGRFADSVRERVFEPLGMTSTFLELPESMDHRVVLRPPGDEAPGSNRASWRHAMGGGGGFSNAWDLATFCQAFLNGGRYGDARLLSRAAVHEMTGNQIPGTGVANWDRVWIPEASWGLGWMVQASNRWKYDHGALQPVGSFYHQGAASAGVWADHASGVIGIYLSLGGLRSRETLDSDWEFPVFQNMVTAAVSDR